MPPRWYERRSRHAEPRMPVANVWQLVLQWLLRATEPGAAVRVMPDERRPIAGLFVGPTLLLVALALIVLRLPTDYTRSELAPWLLPPAICWTIGMLVLFSGIRRFGAMVPLRTQVAAVEANEEGLLAGLARCRREGEDVVAWLTDRGFTSLRVRSWIIGRADGRIEQDLRDYLEDPAPRARIRRPTRPESPDASDGEAQARAGEL